MDPIAVSLMNLGGVGVLAAAMLLLHREALKSFRSELTAERDNYAKQAQIDRELHAKQLADSVNMTLRHHEQVMSALTAQSTETAAAFGRLFGLMEGRK